MPGSDYFNRLPSVLKGDKAQAIVKNAHGKMQEYQAKKENLEHNQGRKHRKYVKEQQRLAKDTVNLALKEHGRAERAEKRGRRDEDNKRKKAIGKSRREEEQKAKLERLSAAHRGERQNGDKCHCPASGHDCDDAAVGCALCCAGVVEGAGGLGGGC